MAEGLGVAASVIAVIQLSAKVIGYISNAKGASKERISLREHISACDSILQQLQDIQDENDARTDEGEAWKAKINDLEAPGAPLGRISVILRLIEAKLRRPGMLAVLKWPFDKKEVDSLMHSLQREKGLLDLALDHERSKLMLSIKATTKEHDAQLRDLVQFIKTSSKDNQDRLSSILEDLSLVRESQNSTDTRIAKMDTRQDISEAEEKRKKILIWLTPLDYASQQHNSIKERQATTGQWLLDTQKYQDWLHAKDGTSTLFCSGIPGAGKTILTSIVVKSLFDQFRDNPDTCVAYIYFDFRQKIDQEHENMLRNFLKQMLQYRQSVPECVAQLYDRSQLDSQRPSLDEIRNALQTVAQLYSRVFLVLDALDECSSACCDSFLSDVLDLQATAHVSVFATSRPIPDVMGWFKSQPRMEIQATDEDILVYLDARLSQLGPSSRLVRNMELRQEVRDTIASSVKGMFLLARLYMDSIVDKLTIKSIRQALAEFSEGDASYDKAYNDAMERIKTQSESRRQLALRTLMWITCTKMELETDAIQHALAIEAGDTELDPESVPDIDDILSVCAGLVTFDQESNATRLVHFTTQEYFDRTKQIYFPEAEKEIAVTCITYLSFKDLSWRVTENTKFLGNYAWRHWGDHARYSPGCAEVMKFLRHTTVQLPIRWKAHRLFRTSIFTGLHWVILLGLLAEMEVLCDTFDLNAAIPGTGGQASWTPLGFAVQKENVKAVELLLQRGASVTLDGKDGFIRLVGEFGSSKLPIEVAWDMKPHFGFDEQDYAVGTRAPLLVAVRKNREDILRMLLQYGANVDVAMRLFCGMHLVFLPVSTRNPEVYQRTFQERKRRWSTRLVEEIGLVKETDFSLELLEERLMRYPKPLSPFTPLSVAVLQETEPIVRLLLEYSEKLEMRTHRGRTALSWAVLTNNVRIVKLLLDHGAATNVLDDSGKGPMDYAEEEGNEAILGLLRAVSEQR